MVRQSSTPFWFDGVAVDYREVLYAPFYSFSSRKFHFKVDRVVGRSGNRRRSQRHEFLLKIHCLFHRADSRLHDARTRGLVEHLG